MSYTLRQLFILGLLNQRVISRWTQLEQGAALLTHVVDVVLVARRRHHDAQLASAGDLYGSSPRHACAVDAGNEGLGLRCRTDANDSALCRHTLIADVDVVTSRRQVKARLIPQRNVAASSRVETQRAFSVGGVVDAGRVVLKGL